MHFDRLSTPIAMTCHNQLKTLPFKNFSPTKMQTIYHLQDCSTFVLGLRIWPTFCHQTSPALLSAAHADRRAFNEPDILAKDCRAPPTMLSVRSETPPDVGSWKRERGKLFLFFLLSVFAVPFCMVSSWFAGFSVGFQLGLNLSNKL